MKAIYQAGAEKETIRGAHMSMDSLKLNFIII
jgi:hypothetical protein